MSIRALEPLAEVLATAARGWPVFPLHSVGPGGRCSCGSYPCGTDNRNAGKHPRISGWHTAATKDPEQIAAWAASYTNCNWAVPTGPASGVDVLDVDPRNGGQESLDDLEDKDGKLPETPIDLTGGGGLHVLFAHPAGHYVTSRANVLGPGLDVKGDGGYIVIPPSVHASGRPYAWNVEMHPADVALAPWPEALLRRVNGTPAKATAATTVPTESASPTLTRPKDAARHAALWDRCVRWALMGLGEIEVRTFAFHLAETWGLLAENRGGEVENIVRGAMLKAPRYESVATVEPATFRDVANPEVLAVPWLIEGLIPASGLTIVAAHYKTGKSFVTYRLILDALFGKLALGSFPIPRPLKVQLWQFEMPLDVNLRRFHKLARGMGIEPERIYQAEQAGQFQAFIQPDLSLTDVGDLAVFHETVTTFGPDLLLVDSLSEAFASADFNSSTDVRRMLRDAFRPVTVDGRGTLALHHKRKASSSGKPDDDKGSILGSQAFGAAARTVYTLDRVLDDGPDIKGRFVVNLAPQGGWDLESSGSVFVIADNEAGTLTTVDPAQGKKGKAFKTVTATMQAAVRLAELVGSRQTIGRQSAFESVKADLKCSDTTVKASLRLAVERGWIVKDKAAGTTQNEQVLKAGPNSDWEDEL